MKTKVNTGVTTKRRRGAAILIAILLAAGSAYAPQPPSASAASPPSATDVVFLFDTSGSMSGEISEAKEKIFEVMQSVRANLLNVAFGVANVEDVPGYEDGTLGSSLSEQEYEEDAEKPWQLDQSVTTDETSVADAIDELTIDGGGDSPEAYSRALWETDTNPTVGWRTGARHEIVLVADNVPHDPNLNEGLSESEWAPNEETGLAENPFDTFEEPAGRFGIPGSAWNPSVDLGIRAVASQLGADGKPLQSVEFFGAQTGYLSYWEYWAGLSGGQALDGESGELAPKLISAIEEGAVRAPSACPYGEGRNSDGVCTLTVVPPDNPVLSPTVVVAQGGGSGVAGGPLPAPKPLISKAKKAEELTGDSLAVGLGSLDCGASLIPDVSTFGLTSDLSVLLCGLDADSAVNLYLAVEDPPVKNYRSIATPAHLPLPPMHASCLHLSKQECESGKAATAAYVRTAARLDSVSEALAVTIGRHTAAVEARDQAAEEAQRAAAARYVAESVKALEERRAAGRALASWLTVNHLDRKISAAEILRARKRVTELRGFPAAEVSRLKQLGLISSRADLVGLLRKSIAMAGKPRTTTLAKLLSTS